MKHTQPRVVITGASSGIGAATAIAFARQGARLVLGARGQEGLEDIARRCQTAGGTVDFGIVDVTDAAAVAEFAADARAALGGIDLWFSNVGIGVVGQYTEVPIDDHRRVIEANLIGHMNDAHAVLPIFLEQDHGIWVNMISVGGYITSPWAAAYAASKFGLRGFSAALRGELHGHPHIHVCDVYPTFVDTPAIYHAGNYSGARLSYPPGALAPETVADAVVALAQRPRATTRGRGAGAAAQARCARQSPERAADGPLHAVLVETGRAGARHQRHPVCAAGRRQRRRWRPAQPRAAAQQRGAGRCGGGRRPRPPAMAPRTLARQLRTQTHMCARSACT
jgi:NADP-dependent 3-hydroxy acid dehydrogenase YdfG